jgi:cobalt/nickel transport system ATP-binding protein
LIELLQELPQTMLIATHDFDLAHRLTTRTLLLSHGQIVKDGSTAEVLADVRTLDGCGLV